MERLIGRYDGEQPGALVIVFAAVHGNELAGVKALREVFFLLKKEPEINPDFQFKGTLLGIIGNLQALESGRRFIQRDLNRLWEEEEIQRILQQEPETRHAEDQEAAAIIQLVRAAIRERRPEALILLDLHTTSAEGGIFCIPADDPASLRLAKELHAPVILGLMDGIRGTLLHFASRRCFCENGIPQYCVGAAFEGGQHDDPLSVSRCIAAVINCLRAAGCVQPEDVDTRHDQILLSYSDNLPKVTRLRHVHPIRQEDQFKMKPGYLNFQPIQQGEHLADDIRGPIYAPYSGRILMPLYQPQGTDGFFVVEDLEE